MGDRKRTGEKEYVCHDCVFTFKLVKPEHVNTIHCPICADYFDVTLVKRQIRAVKPWTEEETNLINRCIAGEIDVYDIMKKTGRREKSVRMKIDRQRQKIKPTKKKIGKWNEYETDLVFKCINGEFTVREVADKLGRTYDQVKNKKQHLLKGGSR